MAAMADRRRHSAAAAVLRAVHRQPGAERAEVARKLSMTSGLITETVARLSALGLLCEHPAPRTGARGRPTTTLDPHPRGPLVAAVAIGHERWQIAVAQLGGAELTRIERPHQREPAEVLNAIAAHLRSLRKRHGSRIRAVAASVPGTVRDNRLAQAANLGWTDIDLSVLWPRDRGARPYLAGNDATFAAVAEARRGAAAGAATMVHLFIEAGLGGAVIEHGRLVPGAAGTAGEFGHMPFADQAQPCRCGARGCWNTAIEGAALARLLNQPPPADEVSYTRNVFAAAQASLAPGAPRRAELGAVQAVARSIGAGAAGLANALDPSIITLGGLGRDLLDIAADQVHPAYLAGLMQFRRQSPPPLLPARFGDDAPLVGAIEEAFSAVLTDQGLRAWSSARPSQQAHNGVLCGAAGLGPVCNGPVDGWYHAAPYRLSHTVQEGWRPSACSS
jgi:predicted NBD/HSP70 family sugar kinase